MRLIDRSQRAIALTAAGKRLLSFAEAVGVEREQLWHDLEQLRDKVSGDLLIASSTIPGEFLLPPLLARFKTANPAVNIKVTVSDSLTVIDAVRGNDYEVGFCGLAPEGKDLEALRVAGDEIVLVVFPEHPFATRGEIMPAELESEPLIFREDTSGTQHHLEEHMARAGLDIKKRSPHLVLGTTQAVIAAVEARAGIAFVSSLALKKSLALGLVRAVKVRGLKLSRDFYCIYRRERIVSRLLEVFITFVQLESSRRE